MFIFVSIFDDCSLYCVSLSLYVFIFVLPFILYVLVLSNHVSDVIILYIVINK